MTDPSLPSRPSRGASRLPLSWDPAALQRDMERFEGDPRWETLAYGEAWTQLPLIKPSANGLSRHPLLDQCPAFQQVFDAFQAPILDATLARVAPGGWIKEHRDLSGGVALGVARFHVPVLTDPGVAFFVDGTRVSMRAGELWSLDTTYRHRLRNDSPVVRTHLIVDVRLNAAVRALLPARDWRDRLHVLEFAGVCLTKGASLALTRPRALGRRLRQLVALRVLGRSVLFREDVA